MNEKPDTHVSEPINRNKQLSGNSRRGRDAPPEVQQKVVDIIIEEGRNLNLSNNDIAYYLAIAAHESGFNPDAANAGSTASGVSQIIDSTAKTYGVDNTNRFDARANIRAGLRYFQKLKSSTVEDYGSADGEYAPLVYYRYHYGEFSTRILVSKKPEKFKPRPLAELKENKKYLESKSVADEARRIASILNGEHGLKIRLEDVMGSPMAGRKAIIVQKKLKSPAQQKDPSPAQASVEQQSSSEKAPQKAPDSVAPSASRTDAASMNAQAPSASTNTASVNADGALAGENQDGAAENNAQDTTTADAGETHEQSIDRAQDSPVKLSVTNACTAFSPTEEWEIVAYEVTTDAQGGIPEIVTQGPESFLLLIPRINHVEYNEAVAQGDIEETGNPHHIEPHGESNALPDVKPEESAANDAEVAQAPPAGSTPAPAPVPAPQAPAPLATPKPQPPGPAKTAAEAKKPSEQPAKTNQAPPAAPQITFDDVKTAVMKQLGWKTVYETSFAYVKQFYTRPKLPPAPLSQNEPTKPGAARTQVVTGSLRNKEINTARSKDKVTTVKNETAVAPVEVKQGAPWMDIALAEQKKTVREIDGKQEDDPKWRAENQKYRAALKEIKNLKLESAAAQKKHNSQSEISSIQNRIAQQQAIRDEADKKMRELEVPYNNQEILKYLNSTSLAGSDLSRHDGTAWCSSFTNWCLEQSKLKGTDSAAADSWLNWGKKLDEPKYGAITVVTRAKVPVSKQHPTGYLYHVGFFVGFAEKNVEDGVEEVKVVGKNGEEKIKKKKKYKKVKFVTLLSGNFSNTITEFAYWAVNKEDNEERHLVSYRWPD